MSEVVEEQVIQPDEPAFDTPVEPPAPELPELSHSYQPTDDAGRPMGGKQVIKYRTTEELIEKMQEQNTLLIRKLRSETRKNRLGISDPEEISDKSPRFQTPVEFKPRNLSPDERVRLSRDLLDPERFDEATDTFFESTVGVKPEALRTTLNSQQEAIMALQAKQETDAFLALNPDYYKCQENFEAITNWMLKNNLAPVRENFQTSFQELRKAGVIIEAQAPEPEPEPVPVVPEPAPVARIPSGLTRNQAADAGTVRTVGDDIVYEIVTRGLPNKVLRGMAAVNAMPADEYKRRLATDRTFSKKIEKLEQQQAVLRSQRRQAMYNE